MESTNRVGECSTGGSSAPSAINFDFETNIGRIDTFIFTLIGRLSYGSDFDELINVSRRPKSAAVKRILFINMKIKAI